jgi:hypothetical protein
MQVDKSPFSEEFQSVNSAKTIKGKNVIIGEKRPEKKVLQNKTP